MKTSFNSPEEYIPLQYENPEGRILFDYRKANIDNPSDQLDNSERTDFGSKYHRIFMKNVRAKDIKELTFPSSTLTSQSTYDKMGVSINGYSVFDDLFVVFPKIILERTSDLFNELDIEKFKLISKDLQEFCHQDDLSDAFLNTKNKDRISTLFRIINIYEKISNQEFKQEFLSSFNRPAKISGACSRDE
jgi:hypothetical protein